LTSRNNFSSFCAGKTPETTFLCGVDDCGHGRVAIGDRTCRCDGCVQTRGRCAGWELEGYGPLTPESGCPDIDPDPQPYNWLVPAASTAKCAMLCSDLKGCIHADTESESRSGVDELTCDLKFPRPWPQPQLKTSKFALWHNLDNRQPRWSQQRHLVLHLGRRRYAWRGIRYSAKSRPDAPPRGAEPSSAADVEV
jgi:hypothetical protein